MQQNSRHVYLGNTADAMFAYAIKKSPKLQNIASDAVYLWITSRSRVPVDGAAIGSDVTVSSCREQKRLMNDVGFFLTRTKDVLGHPKAF
ncbi:hypothetical protein AVEN_211752-1 [Araneus ventricosus]|uniref:Uncharacterized protein n=1 Tax=Araneus ventricosus TaxID=182803 RepID=A0A4Y2F0G2_ARAVE|nr:hypothetical protein AVEN_82634-1 [Araneus ventricosus]GBM34669.1 hypothetical protein AVEN_211752-1 [Araneus ventricosus]